MKLEEALKVSQAIYCLDKEDSNLSLARVVISPTEHIIATLFQPGDRIGFLRVDPLNQVFVKNLYKVGDTDILTSLTSWEPENI